jgi:hypothetical protein
MIIIKLIAAAALGALLIVGMILSVVMIIDSVKSLKK